MGAVFTSVYGQSTPEPECEQLLNGLRVLFWHRPGDQDVLLKLRIHSGAAFDKAGKGAKWPSWAISFFRRRLPANTLPEEMGGRLDVDTDYDSNGDPRGNITDHYQYRATIVPPNNQWRQYNISPHLSLKFMSFLWHKRD